MFFFIFNFSKKNYITPIPPLKKRAAPPPPPPPPPPGRGGGFAPPPPPVGGGGGGGGQVGGNLGLRYGYPVNRSHTERGNDEGKKRLRLKRDTNLEPHKKEIVTTTVSK
ncbi:hypothetical protein CCP3SC1_140052 [Gammaproteobacteria bacterium]